MHTYPLTVNDRAVGGGCATLHQKASDDNGIAN